MGGSRPPRVLGLDLGTRRIGVAVAEGSLALPLEVLDARGAWRDAVAETVARIGAERVVVGLPLSMDGTEGPAARRVRRWAEELAGVLPVPVDLVDERLSSAAAERELGRAGVSARGRRGRVDAFAAVEILERWLAVGSR
jgi:putative Holliday junction resolvase